MLREQDFFERDDFTVEERYIGSLAAVDYLAKAMFLLRQRNEVSFQALSVALQDAGTAVEDSHDLRLPCQKYEVPERRRQSLAEKAMGEAFYRVFPELRGGTD